MYNGATSILGSTSTPVTQAVVPYTTATTLSSSPNPSRTSQPVTLLARVTADGMPVTTGTIGFTRGNKLLGTIALGADGTASLTVSSLPVGQIRIQAIYYGTPDYLSSTSPVLVQSVDKLSTSTSLTLDDADPAERPAGLRPRGIRDTRRGNGHHPGRNGRLPPQRVGDRQGET